MILKFTLILLISFFSMHVSSQNFGFQLGATVNLGTHVNAIGINFNTYYANYFAQINLGFQSKFNFTSYGTRRKFIENRFVSGLILMAGKKDLERDLQLDGLIHNTKYNYSIGYNYLWYFDNAKTSQRSGGWSIQSKYLSILFENDVFGGQAKDRFRSGVLEFSYRYKQTKYFSNIYIWTGETAGSIWRKEATESCPNGYRILKDLPYGKTSHGILSFGVKGLLFPNQNNFGTKLSIKTGLDSEQIRHIFQNKITHDLVLLPKSIPRNTPHYPRLNSNGEVVFEKNQKRRNKFYFQTSLNEIWSN